MDVSNTRRLVTCLVLLAFLSVGLANREALGAFEPLKTKLLRGGDKAQSISVDVSGQTDLYLVVTVGPDNYGSDQAIWAEPTFVCGDGCRIDATTLKPAGVKVGWGKLYVNRNQHGRPLKISSRPTLTRWPNRTKMFV